MSSINGLEQKCKYCDNIATCHVNYGKWEHYCKEHFYLSNYAKRIK